MSNSVSFSTEAVVVYQEQEDRYKTWSFENQADLVVDFALPLHVTLGPICEMEVACCWFGSYTPEVKEWAVRVRNGNFTQFVCFPSRGGSTKAVELIQEIQRAKAQYLRAHT